MRAGYHFCFLLSVSAIAVSASSHAHAGGFALREQSAAGQGMSFAGVAAGAGGLSSMFWNPATITMSPGFQSHLALSAIIPTSEITPVAGTNPILLPLGPSGDLALDAVVPASYSSYQVNDQLWLGLYTGAPFGLATKPGPVWAGQLYARTTQVTNYEVQPTIGYRLNDWLSVGAGLRIEYFDVRYNSAIGGVRAFTPFAPTGGLSGDSYGIGFALGATLTPLPGTTIGVGFRSAVEHDVEGKLNLGPPVIQRIKADLILPETVTVGLQQQITDAFSIAATAEWTNWSRLGFPRVRNVATGGFALVPTLPLDWDDGWFFSIGGEYRLNPALTLRAGFGYEISPISDEVRTPRLPDSDRYWFSAGATYQFNPKLSFDVGYSYILADDTTVRIEPGNPTFNPQFGRLIGDVDADVHIISLGIRYRWDNPVQPIAAPLVRKG
jgi:long-chain fatty acid transport protein